MRFSISILLGAVVLRPSRRPPLQHRLLLVDAHVHMVDESRIGSITVDHCNGIHQIHQRAISLVGRLARLFHDAHRARSLLHGAGG